MPGERENASSNRIDRSLADHPPGLWPFLPAGFPDLATTGELIRACADLPVRGLEIGLPYSDPIADGPVIQDAFATALQRGVTVQQVFECVGQARAAIQVPLIAMVSASIVYRIGLDAFVGRAAEAGFDGLIIPDLSLEEAPRVTEQTSAAGLRLPMLVAPTTSPERRKRIGDAASGFAYYVSVQGTTGERDALPADLEPRVAEVRRQTGLPTIVGFGISSPQRVAEVCRFADGAIVGSAIVRRLAEWSRAGQSRDELVRAFGDLVNRLAAGPQD